MGCYSFSWIFLALQPVCPDTKYTRENTNKDEARKLRKGHIFYIIPQNPKSVLNHVIKEMTNYKL